MEIILGSESPRRREILEFFTLAFSQVKAGFDEDRVVFTGDPAAFAIEVARGKALELYKRFPKKTILTADTIVFARGKIYGKPPDFGKAKQMLKELSGTTHQVFTGVAVTDSEKGDLFTDVSMSLVTFHELTEAQIDAYHRSFFPLDKAGGYAIQKGGSLIVKRIEGCYYNIMGLPLDAVRGLLKKARIDLWDYLKPL